jgi:hypothetical protein
LGVQTNLRTRLAANPWISLKTLFLPHYTWTERLGELFEKRLYSKVTGKNKVFLNDLLIRPKDSTEDFAPKLDNWHRKAKIPILILNATTLNTGHNWQFTATWMGEPPSGVGAEVDGNDLMRRMYYWEAPKAHQAIRLGRAVAASACVPGLFEPIDFRGLYPKRTIRLVDGGVHDNQGVGGLLEQECSVLLVSDASGQMASQQHPCAGPFQVPLRASNILSARVRESQFRDLDARRRSSQIKNLMFIHLKKDLDTDPVDWVGCTDTYDLSDEARPKARRGPLTTYGILKTVQQRLADVRTDLDSFTDVEAFALMLSGYRMTENQIVSNEGIPTNNAQTAEWRFLSVEKAVSRSKDFEDAHNDLMDILKVSGSRTFKIWKLSHGMQVLGAIFIVSFVAALFKSWPMFVPTLAFVGMTSIISATLLAIPLMLWLVFRIFGVEKPFVQLLSGLFTSIVGWIAASLHLWLFDPGYLQWGRVRSSQFSGVDSKAVWWRPLFAALVLLFLVGSVGSGIYQDYINTYLKTGNNNQPEINNALSKPNPPATQNITKSDNLAKYKIDIRFVANPKSDEQAAKIKDLIDQRFNTNVVVSRDKNKKFTRLGKPVTNEIRYDAVKHNDAKLLADYLNSKDNSLDIRLREVVYGKSNPNIMTILIKP